MKHSHDSDATEAGDASPVHTIIRQALDNADALTRLAGQPGEPGCVPGRDCPAAPIHGEMAKSIALLTRMIAPIYKAFYNGGIPTKAAPKKTLELTEWVTRFGTFRIPQALVSLVLTWLFRAFIVFMLWPSGEARSAAQLRETLLKSLPQASAPGISQEEAMRRLVAALLQPENASYDRKHKGGSPE